MILCHERIQPLGYLAWAACGKDPGFSPAILEQAARSSRYSAEEVGQLSFAGNPPDAAQLARTWRRLLEEGREIIAALPADQAGKCVVTTEGSLFAGRPAEVAPALARNELVFHAGRIRGALPQPRHLTLD